MAGYIKLTTSGKDFSTAKYDNSGTMIWDDIYSGSGNLDDEVRAIAVDSKRNVYITGGIREDNFDICTIKYDSAGVRKWVAKYNRPRNLTDEAYAIVVDSS